MFISPEWVEAKFSRAMPELLPRSHTMLDEVEGKRASSHFGDLFGAEFAVGKIYRLGSAPWCILRLIPVD
jgi:hypothetical protein